MLLRWNNPIFYEWGLTQQEFFCQAITHVNSLPKNPVFEPSVKKSSVKILVLIKFSTRISKSFEQKVLCQYQKYINILSLIVWFLYAKKKKLFAIRFNCKLIWDAWNWNWLNRLKIVLVRALQIWLRLKINGGPTKNNVCLCGAWQK